MVEKHKCPDVIPNPQAVQYVQNDRGFPMKQHNCNPYVNLMDNKGLLIVGQQLYADSDKAVCEEDGEEPGLLRQILRPGTHHPLRTILSPIPEEKFDTNAPSEQTAQNQQALSDCCDCKYFKLKLMLYQIMR